MLILAGVSRYLVEASHVPLRRVTDSAECQAVLRASAMGDKAARQVLACEALAAAVPHAKELAAGNEPCAVTFVVDCPRKVHRSAGCSVSVWSAPLPADHLWEVVLDRTEPLHSQLFVVGAGPEAVLRARHLGVGQAAALLTSLYGTYRWDPTDEKRGVRYDQSPALTPDRLAELLDALPPRTRGVCCLRRAMPLAFENSASPAETKLTVLLSTPMGLGGFGHKRPTVNDPMELSGDALTLIHGRASLRWDDCYQEDRLSLEYQGVADYGSEGALLADADKQLASAAMDIETWPVTKRTVQDFASVEAFSRTLTKRLGEQLPNPTAEERARQQELYRWLYRRPWVW